MPSPRYTYLGPEGTFAEAALLSIPGAKEAELPPSATVPAALEMVRRGEADGALVPLENSVEGAVTTTLDEFASGEPLHITREVLLPVAFALMAAAGTELDDIRTVGTHPHAEAQCRKWLAARLPNAKHLLSPSTADAARSIADGEGRFDAAIAAPLAAERYGLRVLATDVGDNLSAVTRFVLVRRPGPVPPPSGADRTTVVAYIADDHPGALLELLTEFAVRGVNLSRIESRPTGERLGHYCFSIDCEGHVADARLGEALSALHRICDEVRFCGSYPRADGQPPQVRRGTSDESFAAAKAWLDSARD
jgi:prephenate dehydratase